VHSGLPSWSVRPACVVGTPGVREDAARCVPTMDHPYSRIRVPFAVGRTCLAFAHSRIRGRSDMPGIRAFAARIRGRPDMPGIRAFAARIRGRSDMPGIRAFAARIRGRPAACRLNPETHTLYEPFT
jgi:hypothetical protein